MMSNIKVIIKRPGQAPRMTVIENSLEAFQRAVGGYIETYKICSDLCIVCNEEGKLKGLPFNVEYMGEQFVGNIIFAGVNEDEFTDFMYDMETFRRLMPHEWWPEEKTEKPQDGESKREAVQMIELALRYSRYKDCIKMLELTEDDKMLYIHFANGASKKVWVECDSVVAMMKDIASALI